jgi:hypothetical protein
MHKLVKFIPKQLDIDRNANVGNKINVSIPTEISVSE